MVDEEKDQGPSDRGYSAFISHAGYDRATALAICNGLEAKGFTCWIAPRNVRPGKVYLEEIMLGIETSRCLVLVLSQHANQSSFVRDEVERAYSKGKPIFPVRIEEILPSRSLELLVSTAHWIDAWQGSLATHIAKLAFCLGDNADFITDLPPELRRRIRLRRWLRVGGMVAASAIIAIIVAFIVRMNSNDTGQQAFTTAPSAFLMGSLVGQNFPLETSALIQDGYDQNGIYGIFQNPVTFELYDISDATPKLFYKAPPKQFEGNYRDISIGKIKVPRLPMRVASCIFYMMSKTKRHEVAVAASNFRLPSSQFGTFPINAAGPSEAYPTDASPNCLPALKTYIEKNLNKPSPLEKEATRSRAEP